MIHLKFEPSLIKNKGKIQTIYTSIWIGLLGLKKWLGGPSFLYMQINRFLNIFYLWSKATEGVCLPVPKPTWTVSVALKPSDLNKREDDSSNYRVRLACFTFYSSITIQESITWKDAIIYRAKNI